MDGLHEAPMVAQLHSQSTRRRARSRQRQRSCVISLARVSSAPASLLDQPHRLAADEDPPVILLAPAERGHVSVLSLRSASEGTCAATRQGGPPDRTASSRRPTHRTRASALWGCPPVARTADRAPTGCRPTAPASMCISLEVPAERPRPFKVAAQRVVVGAVDGVGRGR